MANVSLVKTRRHPAQAAALLSAFALRSRLTIEEAAIDHTAVLILAANTGLTAHDASYLWLARQRGTELATLDCQLADAAASG